ncbi:MAG: hypothetical protein NTY73_00405 [Candidatus Micrarchaeota archaeon]|nr:hypothetical protein [Candidatus Micrarchaeota archaeon]
MKKITILLAVLLLAGCCGFLSLGGSKDLFELVPKTADIIIIARPSAILNDSDLSSYTSDMQSQVDTIQQNSGMDPMKIDRLAIFMTSSSMDSQTTYMGVIIRGTIDKGRVLSNLSSTNTITNTTYENSLVYKASPKGGHGTPVYFAFLDDSTLIVGTQDAVRNTIDVNSGKMDSIKSNQNFSQMYTSFDKNSIVMLLMADSSTVKDYIRSMGGASFNTSSLSSADYFGLSILKEMKNINIKLLVIADNSASASSISTLFNKVLSTVEGLTQSGSAAESLVNNVNVATSGSTVTVTVSTTSDQLDQLQEEMQSPQPD